MNNAILGGICADNSTVRAIVDLLSERTKNSNLNGLKRIQVLLKHRGVVVSWGDLIAAFRLLQEAGCGVFVKGSKGKKSRFIWAVHTTLLADYASDVVGEQDSSDEDEDEEEGDAEGDDADCEDEEDEEEWGVPLLHHLFVLRENLTLALKLPVDLTQVEADRLAQFADSLSYVDPYGDDEEQDLSDDEITHYYRLRPAHCVTLELPESMTNREATRLAQFIRVLALLD